jgi:hypothetical protein
MLWNMNSSRVFFKTRNGDVFDRPEKYLGEGLCLSFRVLEDDAAHSNHGCFRQSQIIWSPTCETSCHVNSLLVKSSYEIPISLLMINFIEPVSTSQTKENYLLWYGFIE